jgi:hypothetical protein
MADRVMEELDEDECLRLIGPGGIGRIAYVGRSGRGWSVLVQGPAHHLEGAELDEVRGAGVETWAPGDRELFVRIIPSRITGRRVGPA